MQENFHVDRSAHTHNARSVRGRERCARVEDRMRTAHDLAEGMHLGEALALQGRSRIHLLFRVEFRSRHRYLH